MGKLKYTWMTRSCEIKNNPDAEKCYRHIIHLQNAYIKLLVSELNDSVPITRAHATFADNRKFVRGEKLMKAILKLKNKINIR